MFDRLRVFSFLCIGLSTCHLNAQPASTSGRVSLCLLQNQIVQGEHHRVQVEGVYLAGLEGQYLVTSGCLGRSTDVEFELTSRHLWKRLVKISNRTSTRKNVHGDGDAVLVVFEGEFYGPMVPDPKLPEAIRKNYHPGWNHNNASMTKLIVHQILDVKPLPTDHPCASQPDDPNQWSCFQNTVPESH